ncbi:MarR family transcriptional regulator [Streptosporangium sp. LJ11]|uniref:MarR family winged helix-turn-helix transcriptional regulator n=1 Tax=Streptosporangium sp. LJ11 TaxID=3436927 RepID=UPI003F799232
MHHVVDGRLSQRELATLCRVTDQTMSRTIEGLHRAGYVERGTDERDRRRTLVEITPAGREVPETARR